jgi:hypothetical protein
MELFFNHLLKERHSQLCTPRFNFGLPLFLSSTAPPNPVEYSYQYAIAAEAMEMVCTSIKPNNSTNMFHLGKIY